MKKALLKIANDLDNNRINEDHVRELLIDLLEMKSNRSIPIWLDREDIEIAKLYYRNGLKLQAVKHIYEFAKDQISVGALRWSKEFLESLEY